jgi:hypothetical protein
MSELPEIYIVDDALMIRLEQPALGRTEVRAMLNGEEVVARLGDPGDPDIAYEYHVEILG